MTPAAKLVNRSQILEIPEIVSLDARDAFMRIPPELDAPLTPRVRKIVDSRAFRRLADVSQLGFVRFVYPGATHARFEHSLGAYRLALLLVKRFARDDRFVALVKASEAETLILAALLHDVGHFPFCHLLEDLKTPGLVSHEEAAQEYLLGELDPIIRNDWALDPRDVCDLLAKRDPAPRTNETDDERKRRRKVFRLLSSILSGPIDVDKMDYLMRDSVASGVPYGKNYDLDRLIGSLCLNAEGDGVAVSNKGKTAAELMVFARYVMFSEVYWHHAARAATAMFQRAVRFLCEALDEPDFPASLRNATDSEIKSLLRERVERAENAARMQGDSDKLDAARKAKKLLAGLFGEQRLLFKRAREFSAMEAPDLYPRIAGLPYDDVCAVSDLFAKRLGLEPEDLLLDAPPVDKEVEFKIDVYYPRENVYRPLSDVSPVVRALAREQFDDVVKRARVFVDRRVVERVKDRDDFDDLLRAALDDFDARRA